MAETPPPVYQDLTTGTENRGTELDKQQELKKIEVEEGGLSLATSIFFVVGDVVGAGVVALPYSMKLVGYFGVPMFLICSLLMCYCAVLLAKACTIVIKRVNRKDLRDPYPRVGLEATGNFGRILTIFALFVNQALTCIVFVLLAGEILLELFPYTPWDHYSYRMQLRIWFLICGLILLPFTYLGSPKDFAGIGFMAMATSGVAIILIITMLAYVSGYPIDNDKTLQKTMDGFLHAFGTVLFGFGGVSIFPTIQADMKKPEQFVKSVTIGYCIISLFYVATPSIAYIILGDLIREDLLTTFSYLELYFSKHLFRTFCMAAQACICGHVLCAFVININPVYQQFEALIGIPNKFCWQRVISRTIWMVSILFTAIVIPAFGPVLSFVGGSFAALLGIILPVVFYARLTGNLPLWKEILFAIIILMALFGSIGNGYVEIKNIMKVISDKYKHT